MKSARRIIAALLAIACIAQPLIPCRCRLASSACGADCCAEIVATGNQTDECPRRCSHSHVGHQQSAQVETCSTATQEERPVETPTREKCPYCQSQSWLVLPTSQSRDIHEHCCCDTLLNVRVEIVQVAAYVQPVGGLSNRPPIFSPVSLHSRIQV
jgi:hypothetical protein